MLKFVHIFKGLFRCKIGTILMGKKYANIIKSNAKQNKTILLLLVFGKEGKSEYLERKTCQRRKEKQFSQPRY